MLDLGRRPGVSSGNSAACTIVSPNYLRFARTLAASYLAHHPGHRFFVLIVANVDIAHEAAFANAAFTSVMLREIGLPPAQLLAAAMMYDILELNTNVKPTFLKHLFQLFALDRLVYLDPDIFCYAPFTPVFKALEDHDAVLTPHLTAPINDSKSPTEQDLLYNGTYNLGFIALRRSEQTGKLLDWWEARCLTLGFSEGRTGLFVDQKWMNLAPGLFDRIKILRDPGCNMAYWNLHERTLDGTVVHGFNSAAPLYFFHFSGIQIDDPNCLSKNFNRFTLAERPDLQQIIRDYKAAVRSNIDPVAEILPYGFDRFSDGTATTRLARRIYSTRQAQFAGHDPFDANGPFLAFAKRLRLIEGTEAPKKTAWSEYSPVDRRVQLLHGLLKTALRLLGPNRYELLMRYLAHITVLRNQSVFFGNTNAGE